MVQTWHRQHPGRPVTELEFGELFASAYNDVASVAKAESGFRKTGIHPFNRNIFSDDDFVAAEATNREQNPNCQQLHIEPSDHNLPDDQPTSAPEVNNLIPSDQDSAENRPMLAANDLGLHENISQDRADTDKSQKISEAYSFKQIIAETVRLLNVKLNSRLEKEGRCSMQQL